MKQLLKIACLCVAITTIGFITLLYTGVIWRSPNYYSVKKERKFKVPIMDMNAYDSLNNHPRPYIFEVGEGAGIAYILGVEHTRNENDGQINIIRATWETVNPDVAFVEDRLGFLMEGLQDPVEKYGEGGATISLAKRDKVSYYTWEPKNEDEIKLLAEKFNATRIAAFYALRPYLRDFRFGKPTDPDATMQRYIDSRTDYESIRNKITSIAQIDSLWRKDFPREKDWRSSTDELGWPKGWLSDIAAYSNNIRDSHLCNAILDEVAKGKTVFVTMGASHAFRIEKTLRNEMTRKAYLYGQRNQGIRVPTAFWVRKSLDSGSS